MYIYIAAEVASYSGFHYQFCADKKREEIIIRRITETFSCAVGNFRKWILYKCFMSLSLIAIQTNIKFLKITVTWTNIW